MKKNYRVLSILSIISVFLGVAVAATAVWLIGAWGNLSITEVMYSISSPIKGTGTDVILDIIFRCILPGVLVLAVSVCMFIHMNKQIGQNRKTVSQKKTVSWILLISGMVMLLGSCFALGKKFEIISYIENRMAYSSFIDDNYVDPKSVSLDFPEKKRNLIYIYLESMEVTCADESDGGYYTESRIPNLTKIAKENDCFNGKSDILDGGSSLGNTDWTMAAIVAHTSGLPLNSYMENNEMQKLDSFYPDLTALGNILQDNGYSNYFQCGSHVEFGGRKLYFDEHGAYTDFDYDYEVDQGKIPQDYFRFWGFEDEKLFDYAKEHLTEIASTGEPFNYTMLTVDTHRPSGYKCRLCRDEFSDQYSNAYACSDRQTAEFIEWIKQQDWYENTTVMLVGDHPSMSSEVTDMVSEDYERKVYTAVLNADAQVSRDDYREYSTFDLFPTTLAAMGVKIEGDRLGLGTNLYSDKETLSEKYGNDFVDTEIQKGSEFIDKLNKCIYDDPGELQIRQIKEKAVIDYSPVDENTDTFGICMSNVKNTSDIESLYVFVWHNDDQSDLTSYELMKNDDGNYVATVNIGVNGSQKGTYNIHFYAKTNSGKDVCYKTDTNIVE